MNGSKEKSSDFVFTGWHMAGIMVLFFGTIISVNMFMAWNAVSSWSGLVVPNTYVASQQFNGKVAEAKALASSGIAATLTVDGEGIRYELHHPEQGAVDADAVAVRFKRPVGEAQDFSLDLVREGTGIFSARHEVLPGQWIIEATSTRDGKRIMHETRRIVIHGDPL